jgi:hypothetical protein
MEGRMVRASRIGNDNMKTFLIGKFHRGGAKETKGYSATDGTDFVEEGKG